MRIGYPWASESELCWSTRITCLTLAKAAAAALPRPIFDYIDGGADDEITQRRNSDAFSGYDLLPSVLGSANQTTQVRYPSPGL